LRCAEKAKRFLAAINHLKTISTHNATTAIQIITQDIKEDSIYLEANAPELKVFYLIPQLN
jgi:hypothetical protein